MPRRVSIDDLSPPYREQAREQIGRRTFTPEPPRVNKFNARRVEYDGHSFDSKFEMAHYMELVNAMKLGYISQLRVHVPFSLEVPNAQGGATRVASYEADFVFCREHSPHVLVVEDCKSEATRRLPLYRLKKAMFEAQYGIRITEVMRKRK